MEGGTAELPGGRRGLHRSESIPEHCAGDGRDPRGSVCRLCGPGGQRGIFFAPMRRFRGSLQREAGENAGERDGHRAGQPPGCGPCPAPERDPGGKPSGTAAAVGRPGLVMDLQNFISQSVDLSAVLV